MKKTGDKVLINGHEYTLGKKLGNGLEGTVFLVEELPDYAIKLINTNRMNNRDKQDLKEHLLWLKNTIGRNASLKNKLAIPKELIQGDDIGYIMFCTSDYDSLKKYISFPTNEKGFQIWYKENYNLKRRLQIASFLFNSLELIHISGLLFTDLSPNNVMVSRNKNSLVFIDTDNMRRKKDSYLSVLGTEGYIAPEIYRVVENFKLCEAGFDKSKLPESGKLSSESDIFSAAVIVFQLLTLQHPFIGDVVEDGTAEDESAALRCETDYILHKNKSNESTTLPFVQFFDECKIITPKIRDLFYKTFVDGKNSLRLRPTASEFVREFDKSQDMVVKCEHCGSELIYYPGQKNICWDCGKPIGKHYVLEIFHEYEDSRNNIVEKIFGTEDIKPKNEHALIKTADIVLEENEKNYLYPRHVTETIERTKAFAYIKILDESTTHVFIAMNNDTSVISNIYITSLNSPDDLYPVKNTSSGKYFPIDGYNIIFEINDTRIGKVRTIGIISQK